jgi:parvulin-like peptidyl-prolyl isomerase
MPEKIKLNMTTGESLPISAGRLVEYSRAVGQESNHRVARTSLTLAKLINFIKEQEYENFIEQELIKMAKSRPQGALVDFKKNISNYATVAQSRLTKKRVANQKQELDINSLPEEVKNKHQQYKNLIQSQKETKKEADDSELEQEMLQRLADMTSKKPGVRPKPTVKQPTAEQPISQTADQKTSEAVQKSIEARQKLAERLAQLSESGEEW